MMIVRDPTVKSGSNFNMRFYRLFSFVKPLCRSSDHISPEIRLGSCCSDQFCYFSYLFFEIIYFWILCYFPLYFRILMLFLILG
jgi:hypothetical protein